GLNPGLVKMTQEKFGINPNYSLAGSYICTKLMIDAAQAAGSDDPEAVRAALQGLSYQGLTGEESVRAEDHQVLKNYYLLKARAKADMADKDDFAEIISSGQSFLSPEAAGCKLG